MATASLQELAIAVNESPFAPGKTFFEYLGPSSNNPQKSTDPIGDAPIYTFTDKFNAPATLALFLLSNTLSSVTNKRSFTQTGEYFSLFLDNKSSTFPITKLRNARMTLCADFVPEGQRDTPKEVISNSTKAMNTLRKIQDLTEERFNRWAYVPTVNYGLLRDSNTGHDVMVTVLHSSRLFDCASVNMATSTQSSSTDDDFDKPLAPPSSVKKKDALARARAQGIESPIWMEDLPDSMGRYDTTTRNLAARECIFLMTPEIYDFDGNLIPPTSYSASIGDRQLMLAECYIKMWQFAPGDGRSTHDRIYHMEIKRLHLLRPAADPQKRRLVTYYRQLQAPNVAASSTPSSISKPTDDLKPTVEPPQALLPHQQESLQSSTAVHAASPASTLSDANPELTHESDTSQAPIVATSTSCVDPETAETKEEPAPSSNIIAASSPTPATLFGTKQESADRSGTELSELSDIPYESLKPKCQTQGEPGTSEGSEVSTQQGNELANEPVANKRKRGSAADGPNKKPKAKKLT
ncbi:hypothetical protein V5O48_011000 [Marasmius crinis-equi]|uniref:Uncharacterized protein n=1 Tax=Marasmius crinis-equi TaxID=585013 RepID=A0ABR3F796_9AGAR